MSSFVALPDANEACGAKAVALGRLVKAGFAVPDGFVLPFGVDAGWEPDVPGVLRALGGSRFAVRSSGLTEDGCEASFAGQLSTSLNVPTRDVEAAVRRTTGAVEQVREYASAVGQPAPRGVAVIVQRMLSPDAAGVAFTRDPVTGAREIVIEAVRGLAYQLVSGLAEPERWRIGADGSTAAVARDVLTAAQAVAVGSVALDAERLLGAGQDVEWAWEARRVWVLQARPITATSVRAAAPQAPLDASSAGVTLSGTPVSPGRARGRLRIVDGLDDFAKFSAGEVLVCRATSPAWTPLLTRAAAVVTTRGGVLCHAAIVARELGLPAVTDVAGAMELPDGAPAEVDGTAGTITAVS